MDLQSFVNNFNKFIRLFIIWGTQYPDDTFLLKYMKFAFKIYLSVCSVDVVLTSMCTKNSKIHLLQLFTKDCRSFFADTVYNLQDIVATRL